MVAHTTGQHRLVPVGLRLYLLCWGWGRQLGWVWLGSTLAFALAIIPRCEAMTDLAFQAPLTEATAMITRVDRPTTSGNYRVEYQFTPAVNVPTVEGVSYAESLTVMKGQSVPVEYRNDRPTTSRIRGLHSAPIGKAWLGVALLPGLGLALLLPGFITGLRRIRLLTIGVVSTGTLTAPRETRWSFNDRPMQQAVFTFTTPDGQQHRATARTTDPRDEWLDYLLHQRRLQAGEASAMAAPTEPLLYDPARPARALVPAGISYHLFLDGYGDLQGIPPAHGYAAALLPALVILGHVGYLVSVLVL